jgi:TetR/AcrR family transcriptional repressor of nem operon
MRKSKQETAATRQRIVAAASTQFRGKGIEGTGLDDLMAAAALTHGGFYKHFASKEQVVEEALACAVESWLARLKDHSSALPGKGGLDTMIAEYLSTSHRDNAPNGCPFVALGSELTRGSGAVRETATAAFLTMVDAIAAQLEGMPASAAKKEALWILSTMIGAATMARMVTDTAVSASILREARKRLTQSS